MQTTKYCQRIGETSHCLRCSPDWQDFLMLTFVLIVGASMCSALEISNTMDPFNDEVSLSNQDLTMGIKLNSTVIDFKDSGDAFNEGENWTLPLQTNQTSRSDLETIKQVKEPKTWFNLAPSQGYTNPPSVPLSIKGEQPSSSLTSVKNPLGESITQLPYLNSADTGVKEKFPTTNDIDGNWSTKLAADVSKGNDETSASHVTVKTAVVTETHFTDAQRANEKPNNVNESPNSRSDIGNQGQNEPKQFNRILVNQGLPATTIPSHSVTLQALIGQSSAIPKPLVPTTLGPTVKTTSRVSLGKSAREREKEKNKTDKTIGKTTKDLTRLKGNKTMVVNSSRILTSREGRTIVRGKAVTIRQGKPSPDPFVVVWNIPSRKCGTRYGILPKLTKYGIIHNKHQHFYGDEVVIFYANHLGFYPHLLKDGQAVNGGIPQLANIDMHLAKARRDIEKRIPNEEYSGYAVIDWEAWRPIFRRNWGAHRMYKNRAVKMIAKQHPAWNYTTVKAFAKKQFDMSARRFITATLSFAKSLRPRAKWGFYLFPDCYNFRNGQDYCDKKQTKRNDRLSWLFKASGALYPSIYLTQKLTPKYRAGHIKGILQEAYRIQRTHTYRRNTPVFPYARIRYGDTDFLMSTDDLDGTIGQAATSGSSGIVLWEKYANTVGKRKCLQLQKYVQKILGPYLKKVQAFVTDCSETLCEGHGRCIHKLHSPIHAKYSHYYRRGFVSKIAKYKDSYSKVFECDCYRGWEGLRCERKST